MTRAPGSCARSPRRRCAMARRAAGTSSRTRARCESRPSTRSPIGSRASRRSPPAPAARRTLLAAEADTVLGAATELLFERLDNHWNNVERLLADMLAERAHWLRYVLETGPGQLCARVNASLADIIRDHLAAARAALPPALRLAAQQLPGVGALGGAPP